MERKFLEELGLGKEEIDKILNAVAIDISKHKKNIEAIKKERDILR